MGTPDIAADEAVLADSTTLLSVDKALLVVELLLHQPEPLPARAIAARLGLNRTTAHRLLNALIHRGWVEKPLGTAAYRISLKFLALAHVATQGRSFLQEVRPALERLSRLSRETVHLGVLDGDEVVHVDKVDSPEPVGVASRIGTRAVPHVTALGKALLAAGPDDALADYLRHARALPPPWTATDPDALRAEIERTRQRGYSLDDEESSAGVRCLGVAVRGAGQAPLFAISITGPSPRFTPERATACVPEVLVVARTLSVQFGWSPESVLTSSSAPPRALTPQPPLPPEGEEETIVSGTFGGVRPEDARPLPTKRSRQARPRRAPLSLARERGGG